MTKPSTPSIKPTIAAAIRPDPRLTIEQNAAQNFYLTKESSVWAGYYSCDKTPYMRKILECLNPDSPYEEVTFVKGCQLAGTTASLAWLNHVILNNQTNVLIVFPTEKTSQRFVKKKLRPMVKACPAIQERISNRSIDRDSMELFSFPGGSISFGNSHAASTLRMDSIKYLIQDEVSGFAHDCGEGDPCEIARGRTNTFENTRKIYSLSTPTTESTCRITRLYNDKQTARYIYKVTCPRCHFRQEIDFKRLKWSEDLKRVSLTCEKCKEPIGEEHKKKMLDKGQWHQINPEIDGKTTRKIAFKLSALYSPFMSWRTVAAQFIAAKEDIQQLRVFTNNVLGECWKEGLTISKSKLKKRIADYRVEPLPKGVGLITAGVDVNQAFTSIELVGWCKNKESYGLAYHRIEKAPTNPELWGELDTYLNQSFTHHSGHKLRIVASCIDTGYSTDEVYAYIQSRMGSGRHIVGVKGIGGEAKPIISTKPSYKNKANLPIFMVSSETSNELLYTYLNASKPGSPGYCHFPRFYRTKTTYFDEIDSMQKVTEFKRGKPIGRWVQLPGKRAEANDCRRYAIAALAHLEKLGVDLNTLIEDLESLGDSNDG